jgi:hypothetical protein
MYFPGMYWSFPGALSSPQLLGTALYTHREPIRGSRGPGTAGTKIALSVTWRAYDSIVNRWFLAALAAVVGMAVAFSVVPYGPRGCPGLVKCDA